jgi:hypothetical protein
MQVPYKHDSHHSHEVGRVSLCTGVQETSVAFGAVDLYRYRQLHRVENKPVLNISKQSGMTGFVHATIERGGFIRSASV